MYHCRPSGQPPPPPQIVLRTNVAVAAAPVTCLLWVVFCRYSIILATCAVLPHGAAPVELAAAYALTRPLVRFRIPVELALAALLARRWHPLTQFDLAPLLGLPPGPRSSTPAADASRLGRVAGAGLDAARRYGAAYYLSSDIVGVASLCAVAAAIWSGCDAAAYLGGGAVAGVALDNAAAAWAAGALAASVLSPLYLLTMASAVGRILMAYITLRRWARSLLHSQKMMQMLAA